MRWSGVTFECDYPAEARGRPQVVFSRMPEGLAPAEIDALVKATGAEGKSLYFADFELLERLAPELIVLQDLCHVCAIDSPTMARDLSRLPSRPRVISLNASSLEGIFREIEMLGEAAGHAEGARRLAAGLRERVESVRRCDAPMARRPQCAVPGVARPAISGRTLGAGDGRDRGRCRRAGDAGGEERSDHVGDGRCFAARYCRRDAVWVSPEGDRGAVS